MNLSATEEIATIYFYSVIFKDTLLLPSFTPMDLESELDKDWSILIEQLIMSFLRFFPNPSKKKINFDHWPYLLRRVIDRHDQDLQNPMVVGPTQIISSTPAEHPYFRLDAQTRLLILTCLVTWSLEYPPIKLKIDEEMKKMLKHVGINRTNYKVWHYGPCARVYLQDTSGAWTILTSTLEELKVYTDSLLMMGHEWGLKSYFQSVIPKVEAELERKRQEELAEIARIQREQELLLEKERQLMMGPRRSSRVTRKSYAEDSDDTEYEESVSSEEQEVEPECRSSRIAKVIIDDDFDDPLTV